MHINFMESDDKRWPEHRDDYKPENEFSYSDSSSDSLESRAIEENPNWKQWLPVWGPIQALIDHDKEKPSMIREDCWQHYVGAIYHLGLAFSAAFVYLKFLRH